MDTNTVITSDTGLISSGGGKKYGVIYTDPPWALNKILRKVRPNQKENLDYPTLSVDDCFKLQEPFFQMADDKSNIFMWTIEKHLHEVEEKMNERGHSLHCRLIWDKTNGICPAFTVRFSHEYLLWFFKPGHILRPRKEVWGKYATVMREPHTVHSRKPQCAYEMIEDMFPEANKLELFARQRRPGWDAWGNEIESDL